MGCSPWGHYELDTTERLHFHFPLSCIGEGNGSPLQCSCLESPRDGGAWWAAAYGVAQGQTRLKRLGSSSGGACSFPGPEELKEEMGTPTFSTAKRPEDSRWIMQEGGGAFTGTPETNRLCPVQSRFPGLPATPGKAAQA